VSLSTGGTFNGNARTVTVTGNWTESAAIYAAGTSTVVMAGTSTVTATNSFYNFTVNATGLTVTLGSAIAVSNNLTITAGTLDVSGTNYGISVAVNWSDSGTFTPRAGTVTFNGTGAIQSAESFANVTVSAGARTDGFGLTVGSLLQVSAGSLALNAAGAVTANIGALTLNGGTMSTANPVTLNVTGGNFTVNNAASTFTGGTGAVTVSAGNLAVSAGAPSFGGTVTVSGASGQIQITGGATVFSAAASTTGGTAADCTISGGTLTNNALLSVGRDLVQTGGTLNGTGGVQVGRNVALSTGGTFNGNARTVTVTGNWTESAAIYAAGSSTVVMAGTSTVTTTSSFYNFTVSAGASTVSLGSGIVVSNDVVITSGTLDASLSGFGITVGANWTNGGAFTARSGTVTFNSASNQSVNPGLSPFNNVTKSGGSTLGVSTNTLRVTGALTESAASDVVDVGGLDFIIGTLANTGTFRLNGAQTTQSIGSIGFTGNVQYYGAGGNIRINVPFNSLEIAGSGTFTLAGNIQVGPNSPTVGTGVLKITGGKLDTSAAYYSITVNGDWNNAVGNTGFNPEQSTVFFTKPSGTINVSGSTTWYVFDCEVPGITLVFQAGATQTVANVITTTPAGNPFFRVKGTSGAGVIVITSSNPSASAGTANYWVFTLRPEAQLDMIYVSIDCSSASPFDVPVPNNVTLASPPATQCPGWRSPNLVIFSGTVDSDHNGKIDRILVRTQFSLSRGAPGSFSGFKVQVTGYTLNTQGGYEGTPYSWASLPDDREFYILLKEQPTLDTGVIPSWTILQNNTLVDSAGQGRYVELSGPSQTPDDTAPPVIAYTLAVADKNQVFVAFSEPVEYDPSGSGAGARAIQAGDFQYAGTAAITGMQRITTDGGFGTSEALFTLAGPVTATEEVTGAAISVRVPQSLRDKNALDPANGPPVGTQPAPGTTVHSPLVSDTHRVTDVGLGLNAGPEYGVIEPAYAKDQTVTSTPGVGYIVTFDGTHWLQPQTITVEGRLHSLGAPFTPAGPDAYPGTSLWWDVNVASSSLAADGFWLPPFDASAFNGAVPFADTAASAEAGTVVDTQHRSFVIPPDPRIVDGATVQFMFQILQGPGVPNDLYSAHVQDPNAADWFRHLLPWSFQIHLVRGQRGGATILNNVINPDKGDVATLQYLLGTSGQVTVLVFDLSGSIVNVLARANQAAGEYSVTWDGRNRGGRAVARGIYFVRVVGPNLDETRKVLVVR
jgi:fibronectin-binding autotransporter adhesin